MTAPLLLLGNQNSGKTTLFNALTGLNSKVANYPGVTVEARVGEIRRLGGERVYVVDLPGTYSLIPASEEEELTVKALFGDIASLKEHSLVVLVVDCGELRRGLYLYSQIIELGFKVIIALSMVDQKPEAWVQQATLTLKKALGAIIVPVSTTDKTSVKRLTTTIDGVLAGSFRPSIKAQPLLFESLPKTLIEKLSLSGPHRDHLPFHARNSVDLIRNHNIFLYGLARRNRLLKTLRDLEHLNLSDDDIKALDTLISVIPEQRFKRVDGWLKDVKKDVDQARVSSDAVDKILLHPLVGTLFLIILFGGMLQALFLIAQPLADAMGDGIGLIGAGIGALLPESSMFRSLLVNGVVEGVGSILSFLPLIALLFLFLSLLEDSGYLARATYLLDGALKRTGLCGRSLVPMLSGFACAVPAIMAARTIGNRKERLITIMVTPFLTCSARLPIFGLIVGALFSTYPPIFGVINVGALIFVSMYALGLLASLAAAYVLSKLLKSEGGQTLSLALPPYRWPNPLSIGKRVIDRIYLFVRDVGGVILASTIVIWALFHFEPYEKKSVQSETFVVKEHDLSKTYAGRIGKLVEPAIAPMGLDWQAGVGILASFLAREVFVSTMAVVYGLSSENDHDEGHGLKHAFRQHISPLSGFCLLIFFTLSMQCVSTMATTRRETGSFLWPLLQFVMMSGCGYLLSIMVYSIGKLAGWA